MSIARSFFLILFLLPGCAGTDAGLAFSGWSWPFASGAAAQKSTAAAAEGLGGEGAYAQFSFDWQLAGDPEIMPVQVFDDGNGMWLQFSPDGAWPAVFEAGDAGWRPLSYRRELPYMVIDGVYPHLELRGGHLRGSIRRVVPTASAMPAETLVVQPLQAEQPAQAEQPVLAELPVESEQGAPAVNAVPVPVDVAMAVPGTAVGGRRVEPEALPEHDVAGSLNASIGHYAVSPADITMRQALERWAATASWAFSAEHWAVDVDIPLAGEASFHTDFKSAVRELLAATEMGDRPLQPCFYSNRVLRVVSYSQACDRRNGMGMVS